MLIFRKSHSIRALKSSERRGFLCTIRSQLADEVARIFVG